MTADEYATLMDFLATRFARMDAAFGAMVARQETMEARLEIAALAIDWLWGRLSSRRRRAGFAAP